MNLPSYPIDAARERLVTPVPPPPPRPPVQFCSASEEHLRLYINRLREYFQEHPELPIHDISGTMTLRYVHHNSAIEVRLSQHCDGISSPPVANADVISPFSHSTSLQLAGEGRLDDP
jgi:hypothetical protein